MGPPHLICTWFVRSYERANALVSLVGAVVGGAMGAAGALNRLPWKLESYDLVTGILWGILFGYPVARATCLLGVPSTRKGWYAGLLISGLLAEAVAFFVGACIVAVMVDMRAPDRFLTT